MAARPAAASLRRAAPHLGALALYALLGLALTWPAAAHFTRAISGEVGGVDAYQDAWHLWWNAYALSHGRLPFFTPLLYYPNGVDLFWQTLGFSQGLTALPLTLALGPLAGFNATVLASFAIGGYATFLLARRIGAGTPAALVAGAVFACSPYHIDKVVEGNLPLISVHWIPLYALALHALLERPSWRRALLATLALLWASFGSWYYGLFLVLFTGCAAGIWALGVLEAPREPGAARPWRPAAARLLWGVAPVALWALALAPNLAGLAGAGDSIWDMQRTQRERAADLVDFVLPNPRHPWWGETVTAWRAERYPGQIIWNVALGWVGLALAALGLLAARREAWRWGLLLLATLLLAMGPALKVAGVDTGIPLPFALIQSLPGIRAGQRPNHMAAVATLVLALLAAYGARRLLGQRGSPRAWVGVAALVALAAAIDGYAGPLPMVARPIHPFYTTLPEPDGALLPLPLYVNVNRSENLTAQMAHRWPIPAGYVARPPAYPFARYTPGVREIQFGEVLRDDVVTPGWPESGRAALAGHRFRYIALDLTSDKDEYFARVRPLLAELGVGPPLVADATLEVYAVPRDWPAEPLAYLGAGWQPLERQADAGLRWRWMGARAEVRLYNPHPQPVPARLTMSLAAYQRARPLTLTLGSTPLGQVDVPEGRPATHQLRLLLPPGEHVLTLAAEPSPDPGRADTPISVRLFGIDARFADPVELPAARAPMPPGD